MVLKYKHLSFLKNLKAGEAHFLVKLVNQVLKIDFPYHLMKILRILNLKYNNSLVPNPLTCRTQNFNGKYQ